MKERAKGVVTGTQSKTGGRWVGSTHSQRRGVGDQRAVRGPGSWRVWELSVTLEKLLSSLDSKSDVGAREYGSSNRFRKKYYSMDNNGVDGQRERSMAATEVAAGLL